MRGLYVLSSTILQITNTIKFGMSMQLDKRWHDYKSIFSDPYYLYCYRFPIDYTKKEIIWIEQQILKATEPMHSKGYSTEFRQMEKFILHQIITEILKLFNIKYKMVNINYDLAINNNNPEPIPQVGIEDEIGVPDRFKNVYYKNIRTPYKWQKELIALIVEVLIRDKKGTLILTPGAGKSLIAYWVMQKIKYKRILVLTPRLELLDQIGQTWNKQSNDEKLKFNWAFCASKLKTLQPEKKLVNDDEIKNFTKKPEFVIFATYQSCKKLLDVEFDFIIFDEAHFTVGKNNTCFNSFVKKDTTKLFLTGTPKYYDFVGNEYDMKNEQIYGKIIYQMYRPEAIELNAICEQKILLFYMNKDQVKEYNHYYDEDMYKKYSTTEWTKEYYMKALMLVFFIADKKREGIITKHSSIKRAKKFAEMLNAIYNKTVATAIDHNTSIKDRERLKGEFRDFNLNIVCQVHIWDMGVDIPECDSIVFVDKLSKESYIQVNQFLGRPVRIDKNNPDKMAMVVFLILGKTEDNIQNKNENENNIDAIENADNEGVIDISGLDEFDNIPIKDADDIISDDQTLYLSQIIQLIAVDDYRIKDYFNEFTMEKFSIDFETEIGNNDVVQWIFHTGSRFNNIVDKIVEKVNELLPYSYSDLLEKVRDNNFKTKDDYYKWCNNRQEDYFIPKNPDKIYKNKGWIDWDSYLGLVDDG